MSTCHTIKGRLRELRHATIECVKNLCKHSSAVKYLAAYIIFTTLKYIIIISSIHIHYY